MVDLHAAGSRREREQAHSVVAMHGGHGHGRTHAVKRALAAILALIIVVLFYGVAIEPRLILAVDRQTVVLPHLPPQWDGQRVAVIGDIHAGMWWGNTEMARRAVRQIVAERPAAVFLLGDVVTAPGRSLGSEIDTAAQILRPLAAARLPTYAVLGNHDGVDESAGAAHPEEEARIRHALTALGIRVLRNSAATLSLPGKQGALQGIGPPLYVVGVAPPTAGDRNAASVLYTLLSRDARIVIMHDPDTFLQLPPNSAPLGIAGHTHCGQVRIPFVTGWSWLMLFEPRAVSDGWNDRFGQRGNRLYINCGIGFSVVPVRIDDPPQITIFTLRPG